MDLSKTFESSRWPAPPKRLHIGTGPQQLWACSKISETVLRVTSMRSLQRWKAKMQNYQSWDAWQKLDLWGRSVAITLHQRVVQDSSFIHQCWAKVGTRGKLKIESLTKSFSPLKIAAFMNRSVGMAHAVACVTMVKTVAHKQGAMYTRLEGYRPHVLEWNVAAIRRVAVGSENLLAFEKMAKDLEPLLQIDHSLSFHSQVSIVHPYTHLCAHLYTCFHGHVVHTHVYANLYTHFLRFVGSTSRPGSCGRLSNPIQS